ncbi:MAG: hypothetical protein QOG60_1278 [Frankiaceae bacterium]|nr:hypothetical protein [Frankiaceae bacterium]
MSSIALGEQDLVRAGVLLVVLPLAATAVLAGTQLRLDCTRTVTPRRIAAGGLVRVDAELLNPGRRATPVLLVEDVLRPEGSSPEFALDRLQPGERRVLSYTLRPPHRGEYELGPLSVRLCDPFGFCELPRTFTTIDRLLVTPEIVTLPRVDPTGRWTSGSAARGSGAGSSGEDDLGTRPYRLGDELRRVHWRTTARIGELSVRREEQPRQGSVLLVLDVRPASWPTSHAGDDGFETAVSVAASIASALAASGTGVRLVTLHGEQIAAVAAGRWSSATDLSRLLDRLATLEPTDGALAGRGHPSRPVLSTGGSGDALVAVLGRWKAADAALLPVSNAGPGLALFVGSAAGDSGDRVLAAAGWHTTGVPDLAALPLVWQRTGAGADAVGQRRSR